MSAEVMVFLDTERGGRFFDVRTYRIEAFRTIQELQLLCQSAQYDDLHMNASIPILSYPERGKLASLHISIYAVDHNGVHGILHASPSRHIAFKNHTEFERLIQRESDRALKRLQAKARVQNHIASQASAQSASLRQPSCVQS